MKNLLIVLCLLCSFSAFAQEKLGLGVMIGNPTGLNAKKWLSDNRAVDGGLAWSFGKHSNLSLHSDYLFHKEDAFYLNEKHPLDFFYGVGGRMEFADDIELGVRIPVGLVFNVEEQPADIFAEAAPIVDFIGKTGFELHLAVGARYYFN